MICPKCGGGGKVGCTMCKGTGLYHEEDGITNEEWFTSLSTEEKADKLTDFSFWLVPTIPTDERRERIRKKLIEWLKEIHK